MGDWVVIDNGDQYLVTWYDGVSRTAHSFSSRSDAEQHAQNKLNIGDKEVCIWRLAATTKTVITSVLEEV